MLLIAISDRMIRNNECEVGLDRIRHEIVVTLMFFGIKMLICYQQHKSRSKLALSPARSNIEAGQDQMVS